MTALEAFADRLCGLEAKGETLALLRRHVVDSTCAWMAGRATAEARALSPLFGPGLADQAGKVAAQTRLSEIDDIHLASGVTPGGAIVAGSLAMAAELGREGPVVAKAILAGYEAMIQLGFALDGPNLLYRGVWTSYITIPFGMAAVTARLKGLSPERTAHALAFALNLSAPSAGHHKGAFTTRWLGFGLMARQGVAAALAAEAGFVADTDILEGRFFPNVFAITPNRSALTETAALPAIHGVSCKPWCAARQTIAAAYALKTWAPAPDEIQTIEVRLPPAMVKMTDHGAAAGDRTSFLTSQPYQIAQALLAPSRAFSVAQDFPDPDPQMAALMAKVRVQPDEALMAHYPASWPAHVTLRTRAGIREQLVTAVPGDPATPFTDEDAAAKFIAVAATIPGADGSSLLALAQTALDGGASALVARLG